MASILDIEKNFAKGSILNVFENMLENNVVLPLRLFSLSQYYSNNLRIKKSIEEDFNLREIAIKELNKDGFDENYFTQEFYDDFFDYCVQKYEFLQRNL